MFRDPNIMLLHHMHDINGYYSVNIGVEAVDDETGEDGD